MLCWRRFTLQYRHYYRIMAAISLPWYNSIVISNISPKRRINIHDKASWNGILPAEWSVSDGMASSSGPPSDWRGASRLSSNHALQISSRLSRSRKYERCLVPRLSRDDAKYHRSIISVASRITYWSDRNFASRPGSRASDFGIAAMTRYRCRSPWPTGRRPHDYSSALSIQRMIT